MPPSAPERNTQASSSLVALRYGFLLLSCLTAAVYFQWRLGVTNSAHPIYSWIAYAAELVGFLRAFLFLLSAVKLPHHAAPAAPAPGLAVDVFVPTYDEPLDVVRRTARAAIAIRYPHRTWILDDGARSEMRDLAGALGCEYVARTEHADAKAGNLNHALSIAHAEFVAIFDADHVADPSFLDRTLGHFSDERLAYVQTPQEFFNTTSFEHLRPARAMSNGASFFHRIVQYGRDAANATIYSGSAAVLRRRALDEISGFATASISEDMHTSLRLHAAGWRSRFHPEVLSAGMAPLNASAYRAQRRRWAQDSLQLLARNFFTLRGLTSQQRSAYFFLMISHLEGWRHLFIYALPIVILVTGVLPVQTDAADFLARFAPYYLAMTMTLTEFGRGHLRQNESAVYNLARAPSSIVATFTAHRVRRWRVTPKARAARLRSPGDAFPGAVLVASVAAIVYACAQAVTGTSQLAPGALAVVAIWAAYHVYTAAHLLVLERRCERERRIATRFAERLPATLRRIDAPETAHDVEVIAASASGLTLRASADLAAGNYSGLVSVDGTPFAFELALRQAGCGGALTWTDDVSAGAFELLLHRRMSERFRATDLGDRGGILRSP